MKRYKNYDDGYFGLGEHPDGYWYKVSEVDEKVDKLQNALADVLELLSLVGFDMHGLQVFDLNNEKWFTARQRILLGIEGPKGENDE